MYVFLSYAFLLTMLVTSLEHNYIVYVNMYCIYHIRINYMFGCPIVYRTTLIYQPLEAYISRDTRYKIHKYENAINKCIVQSCIFTCIDFHLSDTWLI